MATFVSENYEELEAGEVCGLEEKCMKKFLMKKWRKMHEAKAEERMLQTEQDTAAKEKRAERETEEKRAEREAEEKEGQT